MFNDYLTGLSNDAIKMLKYTYEELNAPDAPHFAEFLNRLLEDGEFLSFIEDMDFEVKQINEPEDMNPLEWDKNTPG